MRGENLLSLSLIQDHLSYFQFVGRAIGLTIFNGLTLDATFSLTFYRQLLGKSISLADVRVVDPDLYRSLTWILWDSFEIKNIILQIISTNYLFRRCCLVKNTPSQNPRGWVAWARTCGQKNSFARRKIASVFSWIGNYLKVTNQDKSCVSLSGVTSIFGPPQKWTPFPHLALYDLKMGAFWAPFCLGPRSCGPCGPIVTPLVSLKVVCLPYVHADGDAAVQTMNNYGIVMLRWWWWWSLNLRTVEKVFVWCWLFAGTII